MPIEADSRHFSVEFTDFIRTRDDIQWIAVRHEKTTAFAAQIQSQEIGSGYFQETHPVHLFSQYNHYCEQVSPSDQMPRVLEIAIQTAISRRGVAMIALPGNIGSSDALEQQPHLHLPPIIQDSPTKVIYDHLGKYDLCSPAAFDSPADPLIPDYSLKSEGWIM